MPCSWKQAGTNGLASALRHCVCFVNLACGRALVQAAVVGKQEVKRLSNEINAQRHRSNICPR